MESKKNFKYIEFSSCITLLIAIFLVFSRFKYNMFGNIEGISYYILQTLMTIIFIFIFIHITKNFFIKQGSYKLDKDDLSIEKKGKMYKLNLNKIKEICLVPSSFFGFKFYIFEIKTADTRVKLIVDYQAKNKLEETEIYNFYLQLKQTNYFKEEQSESYFLLKNK